MRKIVDSVKGQCDCISCFTDAASMILNHDSKVKPMAGIQLLHAGVASYLLIDSTGQQSALEYSSTIVLDIEEMYCCSRNRHVSKDMIDVFVFMMGVCPSEDVVQVLCTVWYYQSQCAIQYYR